MSQRRHFWLRILLANTAGALAVVGINGGFTPGVGLRPLVRAFTISFIYANCIGTVLAIVMPRVARRCWSWRRGRWPTLLGAMAVLTIAATFVATVVLFGAGFIPRGQFKPWLIGSISTSLVISLIIGVAVTGYEIMRGRLEVAAVALRTKERDEAEARRIAAQAQLASLESRVQPHFLFNTLNSIAALVHEDPAGAERMTTQLASLMRSALDGQSAALVPLEGELRVVRDYLEIERVRFGDRLRYRIDADGVAPATLVPRLSLQTLVENSVKYAVSPRREGATIVVAVENGDTSLHLRVEDDGPGFDVRNIPADHGLALLRARLAMVFGSRAQLQIDSTPRGTTVDMRLPSEPVPPPAASGQPRA